MNFGIKPPRNSDHIYSFESEVSFYDPIYNSPKVKEYEEIFGVVINKDSPNGWMDCVSNIAEHYDRWGSCLVYCASGNGVLYVEDTMTYLEKCCYTVFDDKAKHSLKVLRPMRLLILGLKNKTKEFGKNHRFNYVDYTWIKK